MENNTISVNLFARLVVLSLINEGYNEKNESTFALLPSNLMDRISYILEKTGDKYANLIDKDIFNNYADRWEEAFYESLRESAKDLKVRYGEAGSLFSIRFYCSKERALELIDLYNTSQYKEQMDSFTELLINPFLMDIEDNQVLGI